MVSTRSQGKKDFATRLSPQTLSQLDQLIQSGRFKTRTAAIEAAVERLVEVEEQEQEELQRAFDRACGALRLGMDRERWKEAQVDRLDWEASKHG